MAVLPPAADVARGGGRRATRLQRALRLLAATLTVLGLALFAAGQHGAGRPSFTARLTRLNDAQGSASVRLRLDSSTATITEQVRGLADVLGGRAYPHLQHIHIAGQARCPDLSADTNGDGVVDITEGIRVYGAIGTTLSTSGATGPAAGHSLTSVPVGGSYDYRRTVPLSSATLRSLTLGTAVIVVHGLDPASLPRSAQREESYGGPPMELAVTSPALCGPLHPMTDPTGTLGAALAGAGVLIGAVTLAGRSSPV
jgi:hypothetical protein